jgi:hypothetical protein
MSKHIFSDNEYNSNDGMLTYIWGPALWHSLHTISFNYPVKPTKEQQKDYLKFFTDIKNILPCKYCRDNYAKNLLENPITSNVLKNRETFSKWLYELHEKVNTNLGKKSNLTYDDVRDRYEHFRSRCLINPKEKPNGKEKGCTESLYGIRSKCIINIVPKETKTSSFKIDSKCKIKKKK